MTYGQHLQQEFLARLTEEEQHDFCHEHCEFGNDVKNKYHNAHWQGHYETGKHIKNLQRHYFELMPEEDQQGQYLQIRLVVIVERRADGQAAAVQVNPAEIDAPSKRSQ